MSLFKRSDSPNWWVKFTHNGRRIQHSTGTADQAKAQEYHDKLKASLWDQERLGLKPRRTWNEAVVKYIAETTHKASQSDDKAHLRWVDRFLHGVGLDNIDRELLDRIMSARLAAGVANSTVNRTLEVVRAVLRRALRLGLDRQSPARANVAGAEAAHTLVDARGSGPTHRNPADAFGGDGAVLPGDGFATVERYRPAVDPGRSGAAHGMDSCRPGQGEEGNCGTAECGGCDQSSDEQLGKHSTHVFSLPGKAGAPGQHQGMAAALKRVGISDFRWHDLRHTWASWHVQAGTPLHVLQELGSWECVEMVRKYAHLCQRPSRAVRRPHVRAYGWCRTGKWLRCGYSASQMKKGLRFRKPLIEWRARQDLNPRPPGS